MSLLRTPGWTLPATLSLVATVLYFLGLDAALEFDRQDLTQGQWWRLLSGNLLHTNFNHLLLNVGGVWMMWLFHGAYYTRTNYLALLATNFLVVGLGIYLLNPETRWYVGLSGALHGLFVWGAIMDIKHKEKTGYWLLVGILAKVAWEQTSGASATLAKFIDATVMVDAHLYGTLVGIVTATLGWFIRYPFGSKP